MPATKSKKSRGQKRKLSEMNIDEFMAHGFDSDVSTGDEGEITNSHEMPTVDSSSSKSKTQKHQDQLVRLKSKDPEFYKFLQENDEELLEFNDSETEDELQVDESDECEDAENVSESANKDGGEDHHYVNDDGDGDNDGDDDDMHDHEAQDNVAEKKGKLVTIAMIKSWNKGLQKNSLASLKQMVQAFECAVQDSLFNEESEEQRTPKYRVEDSDVFNTLIQMCLKNVLAVVENHLGKSLAKPVNFTRSQLPSAIRHWSQVKTTMKLYLKSVLQVLRKLSNPSMLCVIVQHTHKLCPYYASFPKISKAFVKRMVRMWSSGEEHVRVMAFLGLTKLLRLTPSTLMDFTIKHLYTSFVKNCKFTSAATLPLIVFMQNSLIEIFSLNPTATYQQGFVYIRQLAIHLRNAMIQRKKDSFQSVYNWQFIHCLRLWSRVLSEVPDKKALEPLIYPLVQVTLGVIRLNPTSRYYPLRFHCIRSLNLLSEATDTFIPVAPFLLEILDGAEFNKPSKLSTAKPNNFSVILKVSKQQLHAKGFQDSVMENIVELLLEHFSIHAHTIAFPELAFPCVIKMKHFVKTSKVVRLSKQIKQVIEKLDETSKEVTQRRSTVSFSPKDIEEVERWQTEYRKQPNAIVRFYNRWKSMKVYLPKQEESAKIDDETESDEQTETRTKKRMKVKSKASKKIRGEDVERTVKNAKEIKHALDIAGKSEDNDIADIVEDFQFSDSDID